MKKKPNPELIDEDSPEWTEEMFAQAKPFSALSARLKAKLRGRPKLPDAKVAISLRLPPKTLARWKATGRGWQTRMAEKLAKAVAPDNRRA